MTVIRTGRVSLAIVFAAPLLAAMLTACGGDPPPAPVTPPPPPADTTPPPPPPPPAPAADPPKPEVPWTTLVDFSALPAARAAKPEDKKMFGLLTDIKKTHKECGGTTPTVTSQSASQGAFTAKSVKETAYIVEWNCNAKGTKTPKQELVFRRLVIVGGDKGDKVTREVDIPEHLIGAMTDLDSDSDNELVLINGVGAISARLVELGDAPAGQLAAIYSWSSLGSSDCTGGQQDAPKLTYRKTDAQEFNVERAKRPCTAAPAAAATPAAATPAKK